MDVDRLISRRELLKRGGVLAGSGLALPSLLAACAPSKPAPAAGSASPTTPASLEGAQIKVSTYGGFFEDNFKTMYPAFTDETGVEVQSIAEPTSEVWVVQLQQSVEAGTPPPADVSMLSGVGVQRAINGGILATYDLSAIPNNEFLAEGYIRTDDTGAVAGIGAVSWYITIVSNTDRVATSPDSWTAFWDPTWQNELALLKNAANSYLIEICATCYFDGYDILETQDGVIQVLTKLQEVKPNVKLWFRDEGTAQQAYNSGEVSLGQFYHDITTYAASQGEPLRSVFPTEGAILDSGYWSISKNTENLAACQAFVNYMCTPDVQAELARTLGTTPTAAKEHMDLTEKEYEAVGGPGPEAALRPKYEMYDVWEDFIDQQWTEMILS
ncbi:MAG TPA: extracellular solute-binding protein [Actinomycetota bacterium]|jgi:putative spermidine/putrescine transport system substrate-binding protein|nr:extracellular solute-binding protein [Actinomycetota bacterium]